MYSRPTKGVLSVFSFCFLRILFLYNKRTIFFSIYLCTFILHGKTAFFIYMYCFLWLQIETFYLFQENQFSVVVTLLLRIMILSLKKYKQRFVISKGHLFIDFCFLEIQQEMLEEGGWNQHCPKSSWDTQAAPASPDPPNPTPTLSITRQKKRRNSHTSGPWLSSLLKEESEMILFYMCFFFLIIINKVLEACFFFFFK